MIIIFLSSMSSIALAQEYQMYLKARLSFGANDVDCDSWFGIALKTADNDVYRWYEQVHVSEDNWVQFEKNMSFPANKRIVSIEIEAKRESGCDLRDTGVKTYNIPVSWYPCGYSGVLKNLFQGYDVESTLEISIEPLSLNNNEFVIQTESAVTVDFQNWYWFSIYAEHTDGTDMLLLNRPWRNEVPGQFLKTNETRMLTNSQRKTIRRIRVETYSPTQGRIVTQRYGVSDTGGDLDILLKDVFVDALPGNTLSVRLRRPKTPLNGDESGLLPSDMPVTLTIPDFNKEAFHWQYSIEGGPFTAFPTALGTDNKVTFTGKQLLGSSWETHLFKNIQIKALYNCTPGRETETTTLVHVPSAPGIVSITPSMSSCNGVNDAALDILFDRPLYANETLTVFLNSIASQASQGSFDANNNLHLANLSPGSYTITLMTKFDLPNTTNDPNGYSDGPQHKGNTTIPVRPALTNFTGTSANVHCYGGADGFITVSAAGGTGSYTASLEVGGVPSAQQNFVTAKSTTFANLSAAGYIVRLKDSNGCEPKDNGGNVQTLSFNITQPTQALLASTVVATEPLGYGLQNGSITIRAEAGSAPYTFAWTDADGNSQTPGAPVQDGVTVTSSLSGIGKGTYHVRVQDNQYLLASPATALNTRGCFDTLTIVLDQPPLLTVNVDEQHYVSCYAAQDGELVAHANGGRPYAAGHPLHPYQYAWFIVNGNTLVPVGATDSIATDRPAALYRVRVTDKNGIIAWSPDFTLVQPAPLAIAFQTPPLLCNGDTNGTSTATVTGGTPGYQYAWSTDASTPAITNLSEGWYSLVVKDTRGCTTFSQTQVSVPDGLRVEASLVYPTCSRYTDGTISLAISGGKAPYQSVWDHGAQGSVIQQLGEGQYAVTITDANGCFLKRNYILEDPAILPLDLGPDRVLCRDQQLNLNIALAEGGTQYQWTRNGSPFASGAAVALSDPGTYVATITNSKGCFRSDDIIISRQDVDISASIMVASRAPVGETVRVANISHPAPERIAWIVPSGAKVVEETTGYLDLRFDTKGDYTIGMTGYVGNCEQTGYTQVSIVDKRDLTDYQTPAEPYIKQFMVTPNPNEGRFTASVTLREVGDFTLTLHTLQGTVITSQSITRQDFARVDFDVVDKVGKGVYILRLSTAKDQAVFKIVVQ